MGSLLVLIYLLSIVVLSLGVNHNAALHLSPKDVELQESKNLCLDNCSSNGFCVDGICKCNYGFRGLWCTVEESGKEKKKQVQISEQSLCLENCNSIQGKCVGGLCVCIEGYRGLWCNANSFVRTLDVMKDTLNDLVDKRESSEKKVNDLQTTIDSLIFKLETEALSDPLKAASETNGDGENGKDASTTGDGANSAIEKQIEDLSNQLEIAKADLSYITTQTEAIHSKMTSQLDLYSASASAQSESVQDDIAHYRELLADLEEDINTALSKNVIDCHMGFEEGCTPEQIESMEVAKADLEATINEKLKLLDSVAMPTNLATPDSTPEPTILIPGSSLSPDSPTAVIIPTEPVQCTNECHVHGTCENGICLCDEGYRGVGCEHNLEDLKKKKDAEIAAIKDEIKEAQNQIEILKEDEQKLKDKLDDPKINDSQKDEIVKKLNDLSQNKEDLKKITDDLHDAVSPPLEEEPCSEVCELHGKCVDVGLCHCNTGYRGIWCQKMEFDCLNECSNNGVCEKVEISEGHSYGKCQCSRDEYHAFYGVDCSLKSPYSTTINVGVTLTTPDGLLVVPISSIPKNGDLETIYNTVKFQPEGSESPVDGFVLKHDIGLQTVLNSKGVVETIHVYDGNALVLNLKVSQLIESDISEDSDTFNIIGPLLFSTGNYLSIGTEETFEIRKVIGVTKSETNPSLSIFSVDKPFDNYHSTEEMITLMSLSASVPLVLPLVSPPQCSSDCNAANSGGTCTISSDGFSASCVCNVGWNGETCSLLTCHENCHGPEQGSCLLNEVTGIYGCECAYGFAGDDCSVSDICGELEKSCDHGQCKNGLCECEARWGGDDCSIQLCPSNCNYPHGKCLSSKNSDGALISMKCECSPGFTGDDCNSFDLCPDNCSGHGTCVDDEIIDKVCRCDGGYTGRACQDEIKCLGNCSDNGVCNKGKCTCSPGYTGKICDEPVKCMNDCNLAGKCVEGLCNCDEGYSGFDCGIKMSCDFNCNGNGICSAGICFCDLGFKGITCEQEILCNNCVNGVCHRGNCECNLGWAGDSCDEDIRVNCPTNQLTSKICSDVGICQNEACMCPPGYSGAACETQSYCATPCGSHGTCLGIACSCDPGWEGNDCGMKVPCPQSTLLEVCNNHGVCSYGKCYCGPGWTGAACEISDHECNCGIHGKCSGGICVCDIGWMGEFCTDFPISSDISECPSSCSGHGICNGEQKCECQKGWSGNTCGERLACPNNCNNRGVCYHGDCFCNPGYSGRSCHIEMECPSNKTSNVIPFGELPVPETIEYCSGHGACRFGECFCDEDYISPDCLNSASMLVRLGDAKLVSCGPNECFGHGECYLGQCNCDSGWYGTYCNEDTLLGPCPNSCSSKGTCQADGTCACFVGYTGMDCSRMTNEKLESVTTSCVDKCGAEKYDSHGHCVKGLCVCDKGWSGTYCDSQDEFNFKSVDGEVKLKSKSESLLSVSATIASCPNDCTISDTGIANGFCKDGSCICKAGYGGLDCGVLCPSLCSNHGTCAISPKSDFGESEAKDTYECFCQMGWIGEDCSNLAMNKGGMLTTSIIGIAVILFVGGLIVVPLWKAVIEQRKQIKREKLATGDIPDIGSYRDVFGAERIRRKIG